MICCIEDRRVQLLGEPFIAPNATLIGSVIVEAARQRPTESALHYIENGRRYRAQLRVAADGWQGGEGNY